MLVARLDSDGDVLLSGPAVRAVAAGADRVTYLSGSRGQAAAALLPGIDDHITFEAPWVVTDPQPVDNEALLALVGRVSALGVDRAVILTSFHQSPLPLALLLRMAWVSEVAAISVDYPGSLLDLRHLVDDDIHEVERSLSLVRALGYELPPGDDGRLRVMRSRSTAPPAPLPDEPFVVVHPGASVPARAWSPARNTQLVDALVESGWHVVVTGSPSERALATRVAGRPRPGVTNLAGRTDLAGLADVLAAAACVVVGNTGPAHLAAAVATPVVSLFAPTVPAVRWRPWQVPHRLLGHQDIGCAGCRARMCPLGTQPCLDVTVDDALDAVVDLAGRPRRSSRPRNVEAVS
ncbi:MAG: glycosyltransferase family 9 protein [Actinobacteria bacterium]|nr:glycosyltransferase family 9 protein [Actinomycetota bacterium]